MCKSQRQHARTYDAVARDACVHACVISAARSVQHIHIGSWMLRTRDQKNNDNTKLLIGFVVVVFALALPGLVVVALALALLANGKTKLMPQQYRLNKQL